MSTIPITLLNSFVVFNESKNIVEAAQKLGITQPALSKQLKQLEQSLSEPIFFLRGRKKMLTSFGQDLHLRLAERIGNLQEVVEHTQKVHSDSAVTTIRIAGRRGILDRISGKINTPRNLHFIESSNENIIGSILSLKADVGIAHSIPDTHELIAKPLFKEKFQFVIPKKFFKHQPTLGKSLSTQLKSIPCLGYKPHDEILKAACSYSEEEMKQLKIIRLTENYSSLAEMVSLKNGWTVLPSYLKTSELQNWLVPIPERLIPHRQFFIIYRSELASVSWLKSLVLELNSCF
ncbi:MAG: LysR family transcriptional regulator [Bdellovibrio sp.]